MARTRISMSHANALRRKEELESTYSPYFLCVFAPLRETFLSFPHPIPRGSSCLDPPYILNSQNVAWQRSLICEYSAHNSVAL